MYNPFVLPNVSRRFSWWLKNNLFYSLTSDFAEHYQRDKGKVIVSELHLAGEFKLFSVLSRSSEPTGFGKARRKCS